VAASLPEPVPGLVFRYDYLRPRHHDEGVENPKERPACILLVLKAGEVLTGATLIDERSGRNVVDYTASEGDIVIVPIQTDPPDAEHWVSNSVWTPRLTSACPATSPLGPSSRRSTSTGGRIRDWVASPGQVRSPIDGTSRDLSWRPSPEPSSSFGSGSWFAGSPVILDGQA
jgi:hypothetical protein